MTQSGTDDAHLGGRELPEDRVIGGVPDRARRDLGHRRRHHLGALGGQDRIDGLGDQEADQAGAGPGGGRRRQIRGAGKTEAAGQDDRRPEGPLVGVFGPFRDHDRVRRRQHRRRVRDLEMRGGHGQPAVVRDADLHLGAPAVAEESRPRSAAGTGQDLDPAPRKADAGAVEALDDGFLGGPPAGETLVVARAVGQLRRGVDLVQETGAGALYGKGDPVHGDGVDAYALHRHHFGDLRSSPLRSAGLRPSP